MLFLRRPVDNLSLTKILCYYNVSDSILFVNIFNKLVYKFIGVLLGRVELGKLISSEFCISSTHDKVMVIVSEHY